MALCHDLCREGHADRKHTAKGDRPGGRLQASPTERFERQRPDQRDCAADQELTASDQERGRHPVSEAPDQQDMDRPGYGRSDDPLVAGGDLHLLRAGQEVGAGQASQRARPDRPMRKLPQQQPAQHRDQGHVERGQEAGIGDAGGLDADLLQRCTQQQQPTEPADLQPVAILQGLALPLQAAPFDHHQWQHHQRADQEAHAGEQHRTDIGHGLALCHECCAPDQGDDEQQQVGTDSVHKEQTGRRKAR